jgi:hypothetical protein
VCEETNANRLFFLASTTPRQGADEISVVESKASLHQFAAQLILASDDGNFWLASRFPIFWMILAVPLVSVWSKSDKIILCVLNSWISRLQLAVGQSFHCISYTWVRWVGCSGLNSEVSVYRTAKPTNSLPTSTFLKHERSWWLLLDAESILAPLPIRRVLRQRNEVIFLHKISVCASSL